MLLQSFSALLTCLALANGRDTGKFLKTVPTISNSLVNLGKMEISFYFNGKHSDMPPKPDTIHNTHTDFYSPPPGNEQDCPCNNFKTPGPSFLSDPTEIINKILKSNDLFKDPTSAMCCESHEHMPDNTVFFELTPNNTPNSNGPRQTNTIQLPQSPIQRSPMQFPPFFLNKPGSAKPKAVEILLFPRRKDMTTFEFTNYFKPTKKDIILKPDIQVVGDKELMFKQQSASVKKDLTLLEKKSKQEVTRVPEEELQTDAPPVTTVNNAL